MYNKKCHENKIKLINLETRIALLEATTAPSPPHKEIRNDVTNVSETRYMTYGLLSRKI